MFLLNFSVKQIFLYTIFNQSIIKYIKVQLLQKNLLL